MTGETTWSVGDFLDKLSESLITKNLDEIIKLNPDIDSSFSFDTWFDTTSYWNESVRSLWDSWIKHIPSDPNAKPRDIKDIKNSDAGFDFSKEPYVKPDLNIDSQTYENVRGDDKIESVLKNKKQMQYTHTQNKTDGVNTEKYIRLLMPKYLRRVEVEDLNRNFWVIAQTIGLISDYLLNPNSPLNKLIEGMLKEIAQLWDNIHRIWEALYALGEKTNNNEQQISRIAEAVQKTKVNISLNTYPSYPTKAIEFRKMLMIDKIDSKYNTSLKEVTLEKLYFFNNDKDNLTAIATDLAVLKNNAVNEVILKRFGLSLEARNVTECQTQLTKYINGIGSNDYEPFRIGCIIKYKYNNTDTIYMVSYDREHMYEPSTTEFFGPYKWCRRLGSNGAALLINDIIKGVYEEDENKAKGILASDPSQNQSYGPITVERDGVNKKPLNKILAEISGFNFALLDAFGANSSNSYNKVLTKDLIPEKVEYYELLQSFLSILCDFETSGMESYKSQKGENVSVIWTIPGVILSQIDSIPQLTNIEDINKQYGLSFILRLGESELEITNLKKYYEDYLEKQTNDNYYKLLNEFLGLLELLPKDVGINNIIADTNNSWLNNYENAVKNRIRDENSLCYKYFSNLSNNWHKITYYTYYPWLILEPTNYEAFTKISCEAGYKDVYQGVTRQTNSYDTNMWKLISSILPEDCFQLEGGLKLIASQDKDDKDNKIPILKWVDIYTDEDGNRAYSGYGPLNNLTTAADKNLLTSDYDANKIPVILGALEGWDTNYDKGRCVGMSSLQPYYSKSLDNYWISFSSADLTGGRVHMRIINSNYRFFSPFHRIAGVVSGSVGECYDASPHNTSITVGYCNPIGESLKKESLNSILKFNSPEYSPNGFKTNSDVSFDISTIYENLGTKKNKNDCTVFRRRHGENGSEIDCVADGFLGYNNPNDFYTMNDPNIHLYGESYDSSGIGTGTSDIIGKLNGKTEEIEIEGEKVNISIYNLRSPSFWTQGRKNSGDDPTLDTGTFHKVREVHAYGAYGIINGTNLKEQSDLIKPEEWHRPYNYNEILMNDLLSTQFFNRKTTNQIYTIQTDFQRFSISGSTQSIYAVIYMSKDSQEIKEQEQLATVSIVGKSYYNKTPTNTVIVKKDGEE